MLEIPGPRVQDGFSRFGTPLLLICSILIASIPFYQPSDSSRTVRNLLQRVIRVELYVVCFLWFRGDSSLRRVVTRVSLRPGLTPREDDVAFALSCFARALVFCADILVDLQFYFFAFDFNGDRAVVLVRGDFDHPVTFAVARAV